MGYSRIFIVYPIYFYIKNKNSVALLLFFPLLTTAISDAGKKPNTVVTLTVDEKRYKELTIGASSHVTQIDLIFKRACS
jgi:hypothetical protein